MMKLDKETAIRKITEMPAERVSKVLIFMAGMEAEHIIDEKSGTEKQCSSSSRRVLRERKFDFRRRKGEESGQDRANEP